jgi:hypothetical protein
MDPGPANVLAVGDTVHVPATQITEVFNQANLGGLEMKIRATGTPTVVGEAHPCSPNDLRLSNLLRCNEGLISVIQLGCSTEAGNTGMADLRVNGRWHIASGSTVRILDTAVRVAHVLDAQGRVLAVTTVSGCDLDLGLMPTGVYVVRGQRADGIVVSDRFVPAR